MTGKHPLSRILMRYLATLSLLLVWTTTARPFQEPVSKELKPDTKAEKSQSGDTERTRQQGGDNQTPSDSSQAKANGSWNSGMTR